MKSSSPPSLVATAPDVMRKSLHELQVHQIELEMQTEELLRTRAEIDAVRARYCDLYDQAPVGYVTLDETGLIEEANLTAATLLGVTRDALVNQWITGFIHPDDQDAYYLHRQQLFETEHTQVCELRMLKSDGSSLWAHLAATRVRNAAGELRCRAILSDITEQQQAAQILREWNQSLEQRVAERTLALQQSKARFRQLAEATFEGIAVTEDGVLVDGNAQLGSLHGCDLADLIGRPFAEIVAPESRALVAKRIGSGEETTYEYVGLRKDGSTFAAEVHGRPGVWLGRLTRISAVRDLSETKGMATQLQAQRTELEHAQRLSLVSEISAGIIHQISQPLCVIGVNASVAIARLQACPLNSCGLLGILKDLEVAVANTRDTVTHLRTLVRPELRLACLPIDFNAWVEQVSRLLRHDADIRKVSLAVELNTNLPPVLVDSVQLHQVLLILIHNAFDACAACPPERRVISITTRALADEAVELSVCDTGQGLAPEAMTRLFEPFFTTKAQGMGIGLRLCRTIVQAHGGSLEGCNNADGIGSTFRVILPCHAENNYTKV